MVKNLFSVVVSFILFILACDTNPITETPDYFVWNTTPPDMQGMDPQGYYFGGNSMFFTPREMAVLDYVYLNGGRLNNVQIVPQEWVELTLSPSTNNGPNEWGAWKNYNYAYLWWLGQMNSYDLFMAYGYGGQFIICFPDLDLIVVTTANNMVYPDASTIQEWAIFDLVADYIVPSIIN